MGAVSKPIQSPFFQTAANGFVIDFEIPCLTHFATCATGLISSMPYLARPNFSWSSRIFSSMDCFGGGGAVSTGGFGGRIGG